MRRIVEPKDWDKEERIIPATRAIKYIHINQHNIKSNTKAIKESSDIDLKPVITVKHRGKNYYASEIEILGESKLFYGEGGTKVLACGARVVLTTVAAVKIVR